MNKPLAIGLIIFFVFIIGLSALWLVIRPEAPTIPEPETRLTRRFPFNIFGVFVGEEPTTPTAEPEKGRGEAQKEVLTLLSSEPVAGFGVTGTTGVRYIERRTGHVFNVSPQGEVKTRISNTTIPKIFEALWSPNASRAILKYFDGDLVRVVSATFEASSTEATPLPASLLTATFSPSGDRIAYLMPAGDGANLVTAAPDNSGQRVLTTLPFQEFLLGWPTADIFSLVTRPSGAADGTYFLFNSRTSAFRRVLDGVLGLEVKYSPSGASFIASSYDPGTRQPVLSRALNSEMLDPVGVRTLAEKCVFSRLDASALYCAIDSNAPRALYPDAWLQNNVEMKDLIWKIDLRTNEQRLFPIGRFFDIATLAVSSDDHFLYFIEKENNSLWSYALSGEGNR
ncbi:MAG: hypothetical protein HYS44_02275 [Candidatus Niyogibacteria bacterium]|nr:hypothetical protein [Candidatus Niyogibacteria bacterium]